MLLNVRGHIHLLVLLGLYVIGNLSVATQQVYGQVSVTPDAFQYPPQQVGISSEYQEFIITNETSESLTLHPGQITLRGKNAQGVELSVLSYNIETDDGDWPARFAYILEEIRRLDVDVIGLQEVIQRANLDNQAMQMADSLGYYYYFDSVDSEGQAQRYGNAIVSRYPIEQTNFRRLQPFNRFRKAVHAKLNVKGNIVDVYNTHLHHSILDHDIRKVQINDLLSFIEETNNGSHIFVTGDFNANPDWEETALMYDSFIDVYPLFHENHLDPEHGTLNPRMGHQRRRIDYVFFGRQSMNRLIPISAELILDREHDNPRMESDHFGVLARFELLSDDTDFRVQNIEEPVELHPNQQVAVKLSFHPATAGLKEVVLSIQQEELFISGEAFDATVDVLPWSEDFSGVDEFDPYSGWNSNSESWYLSPSSYAGGDAPEALFWPETFVEGRYHLRSPPFRTTGLDSLDLSFRHTLETMNGQGTYDLQLIAIADGVEYLIDEWPNPDDISEEHRTFRLNRQNHGVGADRLFLAWVFDGSSNNSVRWSIDDMVLDAGPALSITPDRYAFDRQQVYTSSDTIVFVMENIGGGMVELTQDDIYLQGEHAGSFAIVDTVESVSLARGESIEVKVYFFPEEVGQLEAKLYGGDAFVVLRGESFDPTIHEIPWEEDFSALVQGGIPDGWESDTRNWETFNLNNAGGQPPEMVFWWQPEKEGRFYLKTPEFAIEDQDSLTLSFRYRVRNFERPGKYTLSVITIVDGDEYIIKEWVDPGFIHPTEFRGLITHAEHGLGNKPFRLAWVFDGITNNMTSWDIDDIRLDKAPVDTHAEQEGALPDGFDLKQNYPNPFNPSTRIAFQLPESSSVTIELYDVTGQLVTTLINDYMDAGYHEVTFDGTHLASGMYLYRMMARDFVQTRKLMIIR